MERWERQRMRGKQQNKGRETASPPLYLISAPPLHAVTERVFAQLENEYDEDENSNMADHHAALARARRKSN